MEFIQDKDGTLGQGSKQYIEKFLESYKKKCSDLPKKAQSPLDPKDNPELNYTNLLDETDTKHYMSMIKKLQWAVTIGRFDVHAAVMMMYLLCIASKQGHLACLKRIYGNLRANPDGHLRFKTRSPDYSHLKRDDHDWINTVYVNVKEVVPEDIPKPVEPTVRTTPYEDANILDDLITGRSATRILHFLNGTDIKWYSKRQKIDETATYGLEFIAAWIEMDQIIDLRTTLCYLGVKISDESFMFGENQAVITLSNLPELPLNKRHNILSYHQVHKSVASKMLQFKFVKSCDNATNILSKNVPALQALPLRTHCWFAQDNLDTLTMPNMIRHKHLKV